MHFHQHVAGVCYGAVVRFLLALCSPLHFQHPCVLLRLRQHDFIHRRINAHFHVMGVPHQRHRVDPTGIFQLHPKMSLLLAVAAALGHHVFQINPVQHQTLHVRHRRARSPSRTSTENGQFPKHFSFPHFGRHLDTVNAVDIVDIVNTGGHSEHGG